jgi:sulfur-oxidizing protein SoxB
MEHVYGWYGTTYPEVYKFNLKGSVLFQVYSERLSDVFAKDPYLQMGGDCTRVSNSKLSIRINESMYKRLKDWLIMDKKIDFNKEYPLISTGVMMQTLSDLPNQGLVEEKAYDVIADYIRKHISVKSVPSEAVIYKHSRTAG